MIAKARSRIAATRALRVRAPLRLAALAILALLISALAGATALADEAPIATIDPPGAPTYTTVGLSGTVNPQGGPSTTNWYFQYVLKSAQEQAEGEAAEVPWQNGNVESFSEEDSAKSEPLPVSTQLSGLTAGQAYVVRLGAENPEAGPPVYSTEQQLTTEAVSTPTATIDPPSALTAGSAHFSGHVSPNLGAAPYDPAFDLDWEFVCEPACPGTPGGQILADNESHEVSADATGLEPSLLYTVKLIARNAGGTATQATATETFETDPLAPGVLAGTNTPQGTGAVLIRGYVNPRNSDVTDCHFSYGPTQSYGQSVPCNLSPGGGGEPVLVTATIAALPPASTRHFQLSATTVDGGTQSSADATFASLEDAATPSCPNAEFRSGAASALPDCRAWELASPQNKNGSDVMPSTVRTRVSADGDSAGFASLAPFGDATGSAISTEYLAHRTAAPGGSGWSTHAITPPLSPVPFSEIALLQDSWYQGEFSADFSRAVFLTPTDLTADPFTAAVRDLFLRTDLNQAGPGQYQLITACEACSEPLPRSIANRRFADASADLGLILLEVNRGPPLSPDAPETTERKLYLSDHGDLSYPAILPDSEGGGPAAVSVAGAGALADGDTRNSLSDGSDGHTRIFFNTDGNGDGRLYMRTDSTTTVRISASERGECVNDPDCEGNGTFRAASEDGTRVFFSSAEQLTDGDENENVPDLYMYDASRPDSDPDNLTLISRDRETAPNGYRGEMKFFLGASADGRYAYFSGVDQLVPGAPVSGNEKIFAWHDGELTYIGAALDFYTRSNEFNRRAYHGESGTAITPDGRSLLFASLEGASGLTGYDHGECSGEGCPASRCSSRGCVEYYLYHAPDQRLSCVSCRRSGEPPTTDALIHVNNLGIGGSKLTSHLNHPLSDDGSRVFFTTAEALLAEDTNGVADAYAYDAASGELDLLSTGTSSGGSYFLDATPDGSNAFFATPQQLVGWDGDTSLDLYDARVGGGFPEPAQAPAPCLGAEACHGPPAPGSSATTPASATLVGAGDPIPKHRKNPPRRCAKKKKPHQRCHKKKHQSHSRQGGSR